LEKGNAFLREHGKLAEGFQRGVLGNVTELWGKRIKRRGKGFPSNEFLCLNFWRGVRGRTLMEGVAQTKGWGGKFRGRGGVGYWEGHLEEVCLFLFWRSKKSSMSLAVEKRGRKVGGGKGGIRLFKMRDRGGV